MYIIYNLIYGGYRMYSFDEVSGFDPELAKAMDDELNRQRTHIELIASENLVCLM